MIVGSSSYNNISSSYTIKLNEEESLEFRKEKVLKSPAEEKKEELQETESKKDIKSGAAKELSEGEQELVNNLASRDAEVRGHESAHQAAGGGMVGAANFTYQQGPDGRMYAVGGEVPISIPAGSSPEENIANARQAQVAAMAVSDPSPQDFAVASSARIMEMKAQQQLAQEQKEESYGKQTYANSSNNEEKSSPNPLDVIDISA